MSFLLDDNEFSNILHTSIFDKGRGVSEKSYVPTGSMQAKPETATEVSSLFLDKRMTQKSQMILNTFNSTITNVFKEDMNDANYQLTGTIQLKATRRYKDEKYDYGTLALMLMRIWEIELNVSLVPNVYAVARPATFHIHTPETHDDREDYKKRTGQATFGQSVIILKKNSRVAASKMGMTTEEFADWIDHLGCLGGARNEAAHKETMSEERFIAFYRNFRQSVCSDGERNYFSLLMDYNEKCGHSYNRT